MTPESVEAVSRHVARLIEPARYVPPPPAQAKLVLQRRAPSTLRRHLTRAAGRFAVLLPRRNLAAFAILRELYRSVGEGD